MQIIRLATFNANNVYDGHDDPDKRDGPEKDARGLQAVTEILRDSEADVISLQEIENLEMLEEILNRGNLSERYPYSTSQNRHVTFMDGTATRGSTVTWRFWLVEGTASQALDLADEINVKPVLIR